MLRILLEQMNENKQRLKTARHLIKSRRESPLYSFAAFCASEYKLKRKILVVGKGNAILLMKECC